MKAVASFLSIALFGTVCSGADLFAENQALKAELSEQQKQLEPLARENRNLEGELIALNTTNELNSGKLGAAPEAASEKETVVWSCKLNSRQEYIGSNDYPPFAENVKDGEVEVLKITGEGGKNNCVVRWFSTKEFAGMKGRKVTLSVMVKGENIAGDGQSKFMLMVPLADKRTDWPQAQIGLGSFDWRQVTFTYDIPVTTNGMALLLGLQGPTGAIFFKNLKVTVPEAE